ncbi:MULTISPECIES: PRD domain-containing protein [Enterococcus]|jgi:beta-glucoside operon transcriptional antiterminator|uniref:PRD domain-containing protein n=1 Tax=Enterococcus dispar ATCC 51266 TaxID=1139219 RepID=S1P2B7_9ENTE|nr:PRD domain-containing protein [Enterococcus dispar]EOT40181.1 hypothetical protein OMK_02033 [Enterococcus dispar ATCC 51266]EOW86536.1 hypothetical protein I569_01871 [Enterococcus dispar ATCC 51266]MCU7357450.1 PRD domain-containing protein [Enterococcus dispar]MDT2705965.1 PRD domain-containing protein [Enterococcus dispar]OJG39500.1 hypothetical protein RV01_GL001447 [Enterococcus dispar]
MKVIKVLNNSAAIVSDGDHEAIVIGNGLSFGKKSGDEIDAIKVERKFVANTNQIDEKFQKLFEKISYEESTLAFEIIEHFKANLDYPLNDLIYLSLADHISFAIERAKTGVYLPNAVLHEVQMFYPAEYRLGEWAVLLLNERAEVNLQADEAGFIALHIINARWRGEDTHSEQDFNKIINDLIAILNETFQRDFKQDSINYHRLVTHLKYFLLREFGMQQQVRVDDFGYFDQVIQDFPQAYAGAKKIAIYLETFFGHQVPKEEKVFLTIHINRILQN